MFSVAEKQKIASEIEKLLLGFGHPEMPTEKPNFTLCVAGKEQWSWAEISPNWQYGEDNPPAVNSWNEKQSTITEPKKPAICVYCKKCGKPFSVSTVEDGITDPILAAENQGYRDDGFRVALEENFDGKWCECNA